MQDANFRWQWHVSDLLLNLIFLSSAMHWAQVHVSLTRYYTEPSWVQLCAEFKYTWFWQDVRFNVLEFNYVLSSSICRSDQMLDPTSLDSAMYQAQSHMSLTICYTQTSLSSVRHKGIWVRQCDRPKHPWV